MSATATGDHEGGLGVQRRGPRVPARLLRLASDERLVEALRGGSDAAFEVLYTRHHRGVLSFCRHMLGSAEEAEDVVQHTFLAAYRDIVRTGKPIRLRPWLYTIARNRCLTVLRARRERASDEPLEPSTEHLAQEVERRDDLRALLGDLSDLPHDQRAALVLAELGDMSHDDIGAVLGCPREKVKALVFQARSSLIASRNARETPCAEVREQLANLRGGALRRNTLRRHLRACPGCRQFREEVVAQRSALALILPVAPSLGLKATVMGAAGVTAATGGGSAAVATGIVALCVAGGGAAAVEVADEPAKPARSVEPRVVHSAPVERRVATPVPQRGTGPAVVVVETRKANGPNRRAARPPRAAGPKATRPLKARSPATPRTAPPVEPATPARPAEPPATPKPVKPGKRPKPLKAEKPIKMPVKPAQAPRPAKPAKPAGPPANPGSRANGKSDVRPEPARPAGAEPKAKARADQAGPATNSPPATCAAGATMAEAVRAERCSGDGTVR
jgi:RNA polymerase sigma factor (sigma-70 family)